MGRLQQSTGRSLETCVIASQLNIICVAKIPSGMKYTGGGDKIEYGGKSRFIPRTCAVKSPCDFMGVVCETGRGIAFDAKVCGLAKGFRVNHEASFPQHQRDFIQRMGRVGALAGVLVEATEIAQFLWLDWEYLSPHNHCDWPVVPWDHSAWRRMGPTSHAVQFKELVRGIREVAR